jgi:Holliday junction resolvase RusA-like endonuclease
LIAAAVTLSIPLLSRLPSPNDRLHHMERARMVKQARDMSRLMIRSEMARLNIDDATGPRRLTVTLLRGKGERMLDADNAYGCCKSVLDACVDARLLLSDDVKGLTSYRVNQTRGDKPAIAITITEETP